jgi:hypothetical protein
MKSKDYWRGYMAALEDAARKLSDACGMVGIEGRLMRCCQTEALIITALENIPEEIEGRAGCVFRIREIFCQEGGDLEYQS